MPKLTRRLPRYSLHKPSGQARVRSGGRDFYLGRFGSKESKEAYSRLIAELSRDRPVPTVSSAGPSIGDVILRYWDHIQTYYRREDGSHTGEHMVIKAALKPLRQLYGTTPAAEFGRAELSLYRDECIRLKWSRRHINKQVSRVKRMFAWAATEELCPDSVPSSLARLKGLQAGRSKAREKPPVEAVADAVIEATLPTCLLSSPTSSASCGSRDAVSESCFSSLPNTSTALIPPSGFTPHRATRQPTSARLASCSSARVPSRFSRPTSCGLADADSFNMYALP
jgi:hypothetical protein